MEEIKLFCCHMDNADAPNCPELVEWEITFGQSPDDNTHSCGRHLNEMIPDFTSNNVDPVVHVHLKRVKP